MSQKPSSHFLGLQQRIPANDHQIYRHIMQGQWGKMPFVIFDMLQGTVTKQEQAHEQTAIAFHIGQANMPMYKFVWRPSTLVDTLKSAVGYEFVDVPMLKRHRSVLVSFDVVPQETAAVLKQIPQPFCDRLLRNSVYVLCDGEWLIHYRDGQLLPAEAAEFELLMADGQALVTAALSKPAVEKQPSF